MYTYAHLRGRTGHVLRDPVAWTEVLQIIKTVVAAVVAWVVAAEVFALPQPFLAPWAALLVVHATVYRSLWKGTSQVAATVVGVVLAWGTGQTLGLDPVALAVMLLLGLMIGNLRWLREEATTVAATALIVLTTGFSDESHMLLGRLFDTAIGVVVGLVVNALVWPPLRDRAANRAVTAAADRLAALLCRMADDLQQGSEDQAEAWISDSQRCDEAVDEAWALARQSRESGRLNPRSKSAVVRASESIADSLTRTEQSIAEVRSMARTIGHSITDTNLWDDEFRERWTGLLREVGEAISHPDSRRLGEVRARLGGLASDYSTEDLPTLHWPEYGGLILNLRNIATSMDHVTDSDPVSGPSRDRPGTGLSPSTSP